MKRVFWFQRRQEREKQRYWWKESSEKSPTKKSVDIDRLLVVTFTNAAHAPK